MYEIEGEYGKFICSCFSSIVLYRRILSFRLYSDDEFDDAIFIEDLHHASRIIERAGRNIKHLKVTTDNLKVTPAFGGYRAAANVLNESSRKLSNIESITTIEGEGSAFLQTFGERLKKHELGHTRNREVVDSIRYCTIIRELSLSQEDKFAIKESNIWEEIGSTLEILTFNGAGEEIWKIQK